MSVGYVKSNFVLLKYRLWQVIFIRILKNNMENESEKLSLLGKFKLSLAALGISLNLIFRLALFTFPVSIPIIFFVLAALGVSLNLIFLLALFTFPVSIPIIFFINDGLFSPPKEIVVNSNGEIPGLLRKLSEKIHGDKFWESQLTKIHNEIIKEESMPFEQAKRKQEFEEMMKKVYAENPNLKPKLTPAEKLRRRADELEKQESERYIEKLRQERIKNLYEKKQLLERKLGSQ